MSRFFVKNDEGKWNIYSHVIDNFLFDEWVTYDEMVDELCKEEIKKLKENLATLLTDHPRMTVMGYEEAMQRIRESSQEYLREQAEKTNETPEFHM